MSALGRKLTLASPLVDELHQRGCFPPHLDSSTCPAAMTELAVTLTARRARTKRSTMEAADSFAFHCR
jgi:hypothetical protein